MSKSDIKKFYEAAVAQKKFNKEFFNEIKDILTEGELRVFIEKKVKPIAKEMGYNFSTEELLDYEKQMARKITEQQLESISGGVNVKNLALGGIVSLMALGAGVIASTSSTSAELDAKAVAIPAGEMEKEIGKKVDIPKISKEQKISPETNETEQQEKVTHKSEKDKKRATATETAQSADKLEEQLQTTIPSQLLQTPVDYPAKFKEAKANETLENFVEETEKEFQGLKTYYEKESKNMSIENKTAIEKRLQSIGRVRLYLDYQRAKRKLLLKADMPVPMSAREDSQDMIPPTAQKEQQRGETDDLGIAKAAAEVVPSKDTEKRQLLTDEQQLYVYEALNLQEAYALLVSGVIENVRICGNIIEITTENGVRRYTADQGDAFIDLLYMLFPSNAGTLDTDGGGNRPNFSQFGGISPELMAKFFAFLNDYRNGKIKDKELNIEELVVSKNPDEKGQKAKFVKTKSGKDKKQQYCILDNKATRLLKKYNIISEELGVYFQISDGVPTEGKLKLYSAFMLALKKAVDLETADGSPYPRYLTEHILMSYMIRTLNTEEDVKNLYHHIAEQLSKNVTSKEGSRDKKQAEIETQKDKIEELNDILRAAEYQKRSPYKSRTQPNGTCFKIGVPDTNGKVEIEARTFADCADIALRHIINLLVYSNDQNWDMLLPKDASELSKLNLQLRDIVKAIDPKPSKKQVPFHDLKTRLQMFFLYQRGFIEGTDAEAYREYRSPKGADDVTPVARTLWEYAICNMTEDTPEQFKIVYNQGNIELYSGYVNQLKLMWNIAKALELGTAEDDSGQTKLALSRGKIEVLARETTYDETAFKEALNTTFSLFYPGGEITYTLSGCKYEKIKGNNEVLGNVIVDIAKGDQKLNFEIEQGEGHAQVTHTPVDFDMIRYVEKDEEKQKQLKEIMGKLFEDRPGEEKNLIYKFYEKRWEKLKSIEDDFARLLLRSLITRDYYILLWSGGFYGTFSDGILKDDPFDDPFKKTDLYKKFKALKAIDNLQDEEDNILRILVQITFKILEAAKNIKVNQIIKSEDGEKVSTKKTLADVFYEKYLKPNINRFYLEYLTKTVFPCEKMLFGKIGKIYSSKEYTAKSEITNFEVIKTSENKNEVRLIIKNIPEDGNLNIPSKVYDETGTEYKVSSVVRSTDVKWDELQKVTFNGDFEKLSIFDGTFEEAKNLTAVEFTGKVTTLEIGTGAFSDCEALTSFTIPNSVTNLSIGNYAFERCTSLTSFTVPEGVTTLEIGKGAFVICTSLTSFTVPEDVENLTIEYNAFKGCTALENFTIPNSVTSLTISEIALISSGIKNLYVPEHLKGQIPKNFRDKEKIVFYNNITSTKSWWGNWLYLKFNTLTDKITLNKDTLEKYAKEAGFKNISEIQAIQARNLEGKVIEIQLAGDLKEDFSESQEVKGKTYGTWGKANLRKNKI